MVEHKVKDKSDGAITVSSGSVAGAEMEDNMGNDLNFAIFIALLKLDPTREGK